MQPSTQEQRFQLDNLPSMSASIHIHHHPYFRRIINDNLEAFTAAPTKNEKMLIITTIISNFTKDGGIFLNSSLSNNYLMIEKDSHIQQEIVKKIFVNTINKSITYRNRHQREQNEQPMKRQKSAHRSDSHDDSNGDFVQIFEPKITTFSEEEAIVQSDLDFNITAKSIHKNRGSLYGKWILDKRLGSPCMRGCLEAMSIPTDLIDDHIKIDQNDIMCHIDLSDTHIKIKSFYLQDYETPPKVVTLPLGIEVVQKHGAKRTLVTRTNPSRVIMKRSIMTYAGFIEYSDVKEIVSFANIETANIPRDYTDKPSLLMRQFVTIKNHESGKKHSLIRYYLPVEA
jgi:hypothetical protein